MKYAGMTGLILSTTAIGFLLSEAARKRVLICRELKSFCDWLTAEITVRRTPLTQLLAQYPLRYLTVTEECITQQRAVHSSLTPEDNRAISAFLHSLGKSDSKTQAVLISGFKEYIENAEQAYADAYRKNARLYLAFGFFGGVLTALLLV